MFKPYVSLVWFRFCATGICKPKKNHNILMIIVDDLRTQLDLWAQETLSPQTDRLHRRTLLKQLMCRSVCGASRKYDDGLIQTPVDL